MYRRFVHLVTASAAAALLIPSVLFAAGGAVSGTVKFDGPAPKPVPLKMDADKKCAAIHGDKVVYADETVVGADGGLKNVFVYVTAGLEGRTFDPPAESAKLDQVGCVYAPHVQGMMVGQNLEIINSDPTLHNIRSFAKTNRPFNIGQPVPGKRDKKFTEVEPAIKFKCDMHPWMTAYIFVLDHPFFAVSDDKGGFEIKGLPAGKYTLTAWHEKLGEQTAEVMIAEGGAQTQTFSFKPAK